MTGRLNPCRSVDLVRFWWLSVAAVVTACPAEKSGPAADDALVQKLAAEQNRLGARGLAASDELARRAVTGQPVTVLTVVGTPSARVDGAEVTVTALEFSPTVKRVGDTLSITSNDVFLKATVQVRAPQATLVDLSAARVGWGPPDGGAEYPVARDAQRVAQADFAVTTSAQGAAQTALYFELPENEVKPGLRLRLGSQDLVLQ